jgi:hypothetical protein
MMVMPMAMMMVMTDADAHRAHMGADYGGVGRARAQHCERKYRSD